ncbi:hypothetical protein ACFQ6H_14530 [Rhodococcus sp. NPDC056506]|uniref:hypothetical protein n=1 Tax=Rhodococcus sp. NPDC056506 TaxID=3345844 RepID=UPI00366BCCBE
MQEATTYPGSALIVYLEPQLHASLPEIIRSRQYFGSLDQSRLYMVLARPRIHIEIGHPGAVSYTSLTGGALDCGSLFPSVRTPPRTARVELTDEHRSPPVTREGFIVGTDQLQRNAIVSLDDGAEVTLPAAGLAASCAPTLPPVDSAALLRHELLYVGRSKHSVIDRMSNGHKVLQRIQSEYSEVDDWNVIVVPILVSRTDFTSVDSSHPEPYGAQPNLAVLGRFEKDGHIGPGNAELVDLVERALISYFLPRYNSADKNWTTAKIGDTFERDALSHLVILYDGAGDPVTITSPRIYAAKGDLRSFSVVSELRGVRAQSDTFRPDTAFNRSALSMVFGPILKQTNLGRVYHRTKPS